jgi:hypothetical protein
LASFNPIWANLDWYVDMWQDLKRPMAWRDRLKLLFEKPGWLPEYLGGYRMPLKVDPKTVSIYDTKVPLGLNYYILFQYLLVLGITSGFLFNLDKFSRIQQILIAGFIVLSTMNVGGLFDKRRWAFVLEASRWVLLAALIFYLGFASWLVPGTVLIISIVSIYWLSRYRGIFANPTAT